MIYNIYIQGENNFPVNDWAYSAYMGFKARQADIHFFENFNEIPLARTTIVVGCNEITNQFLKAMGLPEKTALNIPLEIEHFAKRKIEHTILQDFLDRELTSPIFIKPDHKSKEFISGVFNHRWDKKMHFHGLAPETKIMLSEPVDMVSEYRCYVVEGDLRGIKHYNGDFTIFPDVTVIQAAIKAYKTAPAGYVIDFAVLANGETVLVEVNDGFAIGNYGLDNSTYVTLLLKRWFEMLKG